MRDAKGFLTAIFTASLVCLAQLVWLLQPGSLAAFARFGLGVVALVSIDVCSFVLYRRSQALVEKPEGSVPPGD